ncbi:hypothetical protein BDW62DRAFT_126450 [Aspergillus aurantiobrunneus]
MHTLGFVGMFLSRFIAFVRSWTAVGHITLGIYPRRSYTEGRLLVIYSLAWLGVDSCFDSGTGINTMLSMSRFTFQALYFVFGWYSSFKVRLSVTEPYV